MFCSQCGAENPDNGKFCTTCGAPLAGKEAIQNNQQPSGVMPAGVPLPTVQQPQPAMQQPQPIVQQSQITGFNNDVSSNDADFKPENQKEIKTYSVVIRVCMVAGLLLFMLGIIAFLGWGATMILLVCANIFWAKASKAKTREEYAAAMNKCKITAVIAAVILIANTLISVMLLSLYN